MAAPLHVNGRAYRPPEAPTVVVCVDGCEPDYIAQAVAAGRTPWMKRVLAEGTALVADCVMPSRSANCAWDSPRDSRSATRSCATLIAASSSSTCA